MEANVSEWMVATSPDRNLFPVDFSLPPIQQHNTFAALSLFEVGESSKILE